MYFYKVSVFLEKVRGGICIKLLYMKTLKFLVLLAIAIVMQACSTSKAVISHGVDMSKYTYVVFGTESTGDRELDDIIMAVENEIATTNLTVISNHEAWLKISQGMSVLTPNIHVLTEKWDGGHTYITITFYDFETNQSIAVLKSSGIGLSISQDQDIAIEAIGEKLKDVFGE